MLKNIKEGATWSAWGNHTGLHFLNLISDLIFSDMVFTVLFWDRISCSVCLLQTHFGAKDDFELLIFLPPLSTCWDYQHPPLLALSLLNMFSGLSWELESSELTVIGYLPLQHNHKYLWMTSVSDGSTVRIRGRTEGQRIVGETWERKRFPHLGNWLMLLTSRKGTIQHSNNCSRSSPIPAINRLFSRNRTRIPIYRGSTNILNFLCNLVAPGFISSYYTSM